MIKSISIKAIFRREKAQTMVEFALVFPIILLITYGIMEFGRMLFIYTSVTSAAREGARYGAASGIGPNGIIQYSDCLGIRTAVHNAAFLINVPMDATHIDIKWRNDNSALLSYTCAQVQSNPGLIRTGYQVQVTVRNLTFELLVGKFLGISNFSIPARMNTRTILTGLKYQIP